MHRASFLALFVGILTLNGPIMELNGQSSGLPVSDFEGEILYHKLKRGVLLVKLNSEKARIDVSRKRGDQKRVKYWEKKVKKEQDAIIESFKSFYTFGQFYFYYDYDSEAILKEKKYSLLVSPDGSKIENFDFDQNIFLLYLERPSYMPSVDSYSYGFYCFEDGLVKEVSKPFKKYHTMKAVSLFKSYDFERGIQNLNEHLSSKSY